MRRFLFDLLRRAGEANSFQMQDHASSRTYQLPLMPLRPAYGTCRMAEGAVPNSELK